MDVKYPKENQKRKLELFYHRNYNKVHIPNPEILSAIQLCTTSCGLDSTSIRNRPPPSEQTINEPSPSEEMSIIEPSTVDEDVCLSEPSCSEEACTSHQNKSDTG